MLRKFKEKKSISIFTLLFHKIYFTKNKIFVYKICFLLVEKPISLLRCKNGVSRHVTSRVIVWWLLDARMAG